MYRNNITLFNYHSGKWYATVIRNVYYATNHAIIDTDGQDKQNDSPTLHIKFSRNSNNDAVVSDKVFLTPKSYKASESPQTHFTFSSGENADFYILGVWDGSEVINDSDYPLSGFYGYMNKNMDNVYAITGYDKYDMLAHFEVSGA